MWNKIVRVESWAIDSPNVEILYSPPSAGLRISRNYTFCSFLSETVMTVEEQGLQFNDSLDCFGTGSGVAAQIVVEVVGSSLSSSSRMLMSGIPSRQLMYWSYSGSRYSRSFPSLNTGLNSNRDRLLHSGLSSEGLRSLDSDQPHTSRIYIAPNKSKAYLA